MEMERNKISELDKSKNLLGYGKWKDFLSEKFVLCMWNSDPAYQCWTFPDQRWAFPDMGADLRRKDDPDIFILSFYKE